jgi:hypothetical protein
VLGQSQLSNNNPSSNGGLTTTSRHASTPINKGIQDYFSFTKRRTGR